MFSRSHNGSNGKHCILRDLLTRHEHDWGAHLATKSIGTAQETPTSIATIMTFMETTALTALLLEWQRSHTRLLSLLVLPQAVSKPPNSASNGLNPYDINGCDSRPRPWITAMFLMNTTGTFLSCGGSAAMQYRKARYPDPPFLQFGTMLHSARSGHLVPVPDVPRPGLQHALPFRPP